MRAINFSAGPAALPLPALERARDELLDFQGSGMSIMEQSHRGKVFEAVNAEALSLLREVADVPSTHEVFFTQGGATSQFALVPMNFLPPGKSADYVVNGVWGEKAVGEARFVGATRELRVEKDGQFVRAPKPTELSYSPDAAYVHLTSNETIHGIQMHKLPETGSVPRVVDVSSDFLWRRTDLSQVSFLYAGAQKNVGPSGIVVCIGHRDFIRSGRTDIPKVFRYQVEVENHSLYHTPPTFSVYLVRNVLQWVRSVGGLRQIEAWNREKAGLIYGALDAFSDFYRAPVEPESRSVMNVVFRLSSEALEEQFLAEARAANMVGLKGHRSVGGIRVSLYNAVSVSDARALAELMHHFAQKHG